MDFSIYYRNGILNSMLLREGFPFPPLGVSVGLAKDTNENSIGVDCGEPLFAASYERRPTWFHEWTLSTAGQTENAFIFVMPTIPEESWGEITHLVLLTSPIRGTGRLVASGELTVPWFIEKGSELRFNAGDIVIALD